MTATWAQNKNLATPLPDSSAAQGSFSLLQSKTRRREMRCLIFVTKEWIPRKYDKHRPQKRDYIKKAHNQIQRTRRHATHTDTSLPPPRDTDQIKTTGPLCLCTGEGEKITTIVLDSPRRRQIIFVSRPRKESSSSGQKKQVPTRSNDQEPGSPSPRETESGTRGRHAHAPGRVEATEKWLVASLSHGMERTTSEEDSERPVPVGGKQDPCGTCQ